MPRGRIADSARPTIDFSALPEVHEIPVPVPKSRTEEDIPKYVRDLCERALQAAREGRILALKVAPEVGDELRRLTRAWGRLESTPDVTVGATVIPVEKNGQTHHELRLAVRPRKPREVPVNAPAGQTVVPGRDSSARK